MMGFARAQPILRTNSPQNAFSRRQNGVSSAIKVGNIMASTPSWIDIGSAEDLACTPLRSGKAGSVPIAISFEDGAFGVVSNACNHAGGPLGDGRLDNDYITCPWH